MTLWWSFTWQVDPDKNNMLVRKFRVDSLPTVLCVINGKIISEMTIVGNNPSSLQDRTSKLQEVAINQKREEEKAKVLNSTCDVPAHVNACRRTHTHRRPWPTYLSKVICCAAG